MQHTYMRVFLFMLQSCLFLCLTIHLGKFLHLCISFLLLHHRLPQTQAFETPYVILQFCRSEVRRSMKRLTQLPDQGVIRAVLLPGGSEKEIPSSFLLVTVSYLAFPISSPARAWQVLLTLQICFTDSSASKGSQSYTGAIWIIQGDLCILRQQRFMILTAPAKPVCHVAWHVHRPKTGAQSILWDHDSVYHILIHLDLFIFLVAMWFFIL